MMAAQLCLTALEQVRDGDLSTWSPFLQALSNWKREDSLSPDTATALSRLEDLVEASATGELPLPQALAKLRKALSAFPGGEAAQTLPEPSFPEPQAPELPPRRRKRKKDKAKKTAKPEPAYPGEAGIITTQALVLDMTLLPIFLDSHQGEIERLEGLVLELEQGNQAGIPEIKRKVHTFKGEMGLLGIGEEATFLHALEENLEAGQADTEALLSALKRLQDIWARLQGAMDNQGRYLALLVQPTAPKSNSNSSVTHGKEGGKPALRPGRFEVPMSVDESSFLADFKTESLEHFQALSPHILELETDATSEDAVNGVFRVFHSIKGVAGFLNLGPVQILSHALENLVAKARSRQLTLTSVEISVLLAGSDLLKGMIVGAEYRDGKVGIEVAEAAPHALQALQAYDMVDTASPSQARAAAQASTIASGLAVAQTPSEAAPSHGSSSTQEDTLRVSTKKLDQLFDALGEIVIAQSIIAGDPMLHANDRIIDRKEILALRQKIQASQTILNQVQRVTLSLRMVSIKPLFIKMARLTRDVSQKTGKKVEFAKEGDDTEIDKSFVEKLGDPLVHMIRNSVDHGIESPEARLKAGKPEQGQVALKAYHRSGRLYLELQDDGKGLDSEVILRKAMEKGLVSEGARLDQEAIFRLILEPGFSTAQQVTELSGRGVGMDVVRQSIEGLGGSLAIHSEKGKGTRFTISLPLTLAIANGMFMRAGEQIVIIPTLSILECVNPRVGQVQSLGDDGYLLDLRGKWLRLLRLSDALGYPDSGLPFSEGVAVIVENGLGLQMALFVDELLGGQQVVIKSLGEAIPLPDGVQGGAVGSDGKVRLILDVAQLVARATSAGNRKETVKT